MCTETKVAFRPLHAEMNPFRTDLGDLAKSVSHHPSVHTWTQFHPLPDTKVGKLKIAHGSPVKLSVRELFQDLTLGIIPAQCSDVSREVLAVCAVPEIGWGAPLDATSVITSVYERNIAQIELVFRFVAGVAVGSAERSTILTVDGLGRGVGHEYCSSDH